ncbi:MAG TPA: hypothetical protein VM686_05495, partial [Polyangiaceae bacterium]|nr:hypothetical protein [Polyangiaceae bacterium]
MRALLLGCLLALGCSSRQEPVSAPRPTSWQPEILSPASSVALPDFSYAGYRWGEAAPPVLAPSLDVRDFGALPDDGIDDTEGLRRAIAAARGVALRLPRGRYELSDILFIEQSGLVLQGEGSGAGGTVLAVTRALESMTRPQVIDELVRYLAANDKKVHGRPFSPFSWTGGVLWVRAPRAAEERLGRALDGRRGEHELVLEGPPEIAAGTRVQLRWRNPFGARSAVLEHIYGLSGSIAGARLSEAENPIVTQDVTVLAIEGSTLRIKEPLLHDLRPGWNADVVRSRRLEGVGIEHLAIEFPDVPYGGHHQEAGYNGLYLTGVSHGFVRDVVVSNADSAVLSDDSDHVSLEGVTVRGRPGHYGLHFGSVHGFLARDFRIEAELFHSLSFNTRATASVFTSGMVHHARLDQHRGANHQNLFDAIDAREASAEPALFEHGGASYWGPTAAALNVFWNIRLELPAGTQKALLGGVDDAGPARIVGLHGSAPLELVYPNAYVEGLNRPGLAVPSLYAYQLA